MSSAGAGPTRAVPAASTGQHRGLGRVVHEAVAGTWAARRPAGTARPGAAEQAAG